MYASFPLDYLYVVSDLASIMHHTEGGALQLGRLIIRMVTMSRVEFAQQGFIAGARETDRGNTEVCYIHCHLDCAHLVKYEDALSYVEPNYVIYIIDVKHG